MSHRSSERRWTTRPPRATKLEQHLSVSPGRVAPPVSLPRPFWSGGVGASLAPPGSNGARASTATGEDNAPHERAPTNTTSATRRPTRAEPTASPSGRGGAESGGQARQEDREADRQGRRGEAGARGEGGGRGAGKGIPEHVPENGPKSCPKACPESGPARVPENRARENRRQILTYVVGHHFRAHTGARFRARIRAQKGLHFRAHDRAYFPAQDSGTELGHRIRATNPGMAIRGVMWNRTIPVCITIETFVSMSKSKCNRHGALGRHPAHRTGTSKPQRR